jgi:hypothetical protein
MWVQHPRMRDRLMDRDTAIRRISDVLQDVRLIRLDDGLRNHGWSDDLIERMFEYFEAMKERIARGWTPSRADEINMGMWFDSEGITPYEDDDLKRRFRTAADVVRELGESL